MTGQEDLGVGLEVAGQAEPAVGRDRDVGHHQVGLVGLGQDQGVVAVGGLQERDLLAAQLQALKGQDEAVAEARVVGDQQDLDHGRSRSARVSIQSVAVNTRDGYHVPSCRMVTTYGASPLATASSSVRASLPPRLPASRPAVAWPWPRRR